MRKLYFATLLMIILTAALGSCRSKADTLAPEPLQTPDAGRGPAPYTIADYESKAGGGSIPEWVSVWLDLGARGVEALDAFAGRYVFVARNESNNFNALTLWRDGFSTELDFARLAAARVERRLSLAVPNPDESYGGFFEAALRAASDFYWTGAVREDDFWTFREFTSAGEGEGEETENWEFLILVTIDRALFASQLESIFQTINPTPAPTRDQRTVISRVRERFFEGF